MKKKLSAAKWLSAIAGIILIILAVIFFLNPGISMYSLSVIIGVFLLIAGVSSVIAFFVDIDSPHAGWTLVSGLIELLVAWTILVWPVITTLTIPYVFAFWAIIVGISQFANSFTLKAYHFEDWWLETIFGVILSIIGFCILFNPLAGIYTVDYVIAFFFLLFGIFSIIIAFHFGSVEGKINKVKKAFKKLSK